MMNSNFQEEMAHLNKRCRVRRHLILFVVSLLLLSCQTERIVYIEPEPEPEQEEEETYVSVSVVSWSVTHIGGTPYINASGRVKNHGPKNVKNVRVWISSNYGDTKIVRPTPSRLAVGEGGSWKVTSLEGTYIQDKYVTFDEEE